MTLVSKTYSKNCKFCSAKIWWSDIHHYFAAEDGKRHDCPNSSFRDKQLDQNQRLNETVNDLKAEISGKFSGIESRFDNMQRTMLHQNSIIVELKAKIDGILRSG
jgi:hypothetical protein